MDHKFKGVLENIFYQIDLYTNYISPELEKQIAILVLMLEGEKEENKIAVSEKLLEKVNSENCYISVYLYSVVIYLIKKACYLEKFVNYIISCKELKANTKYYLFCQIKIILFFNGETLNTISTKCLYWKLFQHVIGMFEEILVEELQEIPVEARDENMVLVITEQFLGFQHGPSKTALDRCKTIIEKLGKKVLLINTAEFSSSVGEISFFGQEVASYESTFIEQTEIVWKETVIPYFQCEQNMPNISILQLLLQTIHKLKPKFIVMIGGTSVLGNLANKIVPVLGIGCVPSELECTLAKYQTFSKKLGKEEQKILNFVGRDEKNVIVSVFTSGLKVKEQHITRDMLGIPEDKFVVVIVGVRLNFEITDEFMDMLENIINENLYVVSIGIFDNAADMLERHSSLKEHFKDLGKVKDVLAHLECCDLYVNPKRKGGGTSCVEAMHMGLPVVTVNYGDVAVNTGAEFCVENYDEMSSMILKYQNSPDFYKQQSERARDRASVLLDTDTEFLKILKEMEKRECASDEKSY